MGMGVAQGAAHKPLVAVLLAAIPPATLRRLPVPPFMPSPRAILPGLASLQNRVPCRMRCPMFGEMAACCARVGAGAGNRDWMHLPSILQRLRRRQFVCNCGCGGAPWDEQMGTRHGESPDGLRYADALCNANGGFG